MERKIAIEGLTRAALNESNHEQTVDSVALEIATEQKVAYCETVMMPAATSAYEQCDVGSMSTLDKAEIEKTSLTAPNHPMRNDFE